MFSIRKPWDLLSLSLPRSPSLLSHREFLTADLELDLAKYLQMALLVKTADKC